MTPFLAWTLVLVVGCAAIGKFGYDWYGLAWWQLAPITIVYAVAIALLAIGVENKKITIRRRS